MVEIEQVAEVREPTVMPLRFRRVCRGFSGRGILSKRVLKQGRSVFRLKSMSIHLRSLDCSLCLPIGKAGTDDSGDEQSDCLGFPHACACAGRRCLLRRIAGPGGPGVIVTTRGDPVPGLSAPDPWRAAILVRFDCWKNWTRAYNMNARP